MDSMPVVLFWKRLWSKLMVAAFWMPYRPSQAGRPSQVTDQIFLSREMSSRDSC